MWLGAVVMPSKGWDKNRRWYKAAKSESPSDRKSVPTYVVSQTSLLWIPNLKWAALKRGLAIREIMEIHMEPSFYTCVLHFFRRKHCSDSPMAADHTFKTLKLTTREDSETLYFFSSTSSSKFTRWQDRDYRWSGTSFSRRLTSILSWTTRIRHSSGWYSAQWSRLDKIIPRSVSK